MSDDTSLVEQLFATGITRATFLRLGALTAGALVVPGLSACGTAQQPTSAGLAARPNLRIDGGTDWGNPSPFAYISGPGYWRMLRIFDTLIWKDETGHFIPWLATAWNTPDGGHSWHFTLRDGIKWQDGQPLTADDVAFSFTYPLTKPPSPSSTIGLPRVVKGATALSATEVEIQLSVPLANFLRGQAGVVPIIPKHVWSKVATPMTFTGPESVMGSGPYTLASYSAAQGAYKFAANDNFFLGKPYVASIEEVPVGDPLLALRHGDIDGATPPPGRPIKQALDQFRQDPAFGVLDGPSDFLQVLYFNNARAPFSDIRVRHAVAYAINRPDLVTRVLQGLGVPGNPGIFPPSNSFYDGGVEQYPFNLDTARSLLDQAGYPLQGSTRRGPNGPLSVQLLFSGQQQSRPAQLITSYLQPLGITVVPVALDGAALDARDAAGDYDMEITGFGGLSGDLDFLRFVFTPPGGGGIPGFDNPTFNRLLKVQTITQDPAQRRMFGNQIQQLLAQQLPVLPLYYLPLAFAFRKAAFDAWYFTPGGFAGGIPSVYNKQVFVTGEQTGTAIKPLP